MYTAYPPVPLASASLSCRVLAFESAAGTKGTEVRVLDDGLDGTCHPALLVPASTAATEVCLADALCVSLLHDATDAMGQLALPRFADAVLELCGCRPSTLVFALDARGCADGADEPTLVSCADHAVSGLVPTTLESEDGLVGLLASDPLVFVLSSEDGAALPSRVQLRNMERWLLWLLQSR
jgi:hypothetical protein